jgi:16S rRNA (cytosine1402-N4)-methyltransferase
MTTEDAANGGIRSVRGGARHIPVLISPVLKALAPKDGETFIDGTFGAGGYSRAILEAAGASVLGLDRDATAIAGAGPLLVEFPDRLKVVQTTFGAMAAAWAETYGTRVPNPDGIVLDVGVSSMQLDQPERGFSFMNEGPLDMRMDAREGVASAADLVNRLAPEQLANILYVYGDEKRSRAIARTIEADRARGPIVSTGQLARLVERVLGRSKDQHRHPATRTFQALRIAVNDELGELARALAAAEALLGEGGRLAVVSFHSLEDRIVKEFLKERTGLTPRGSRFQPELAAAAAPSFRFVNQKPISPDDEEVLTNPRARSAKLRWAVRTDTPAWGAFVNIPGVDF